MPAATVAISSDFLTAFAALPKRVQQKTSTFINKFRVDPTSPGIHYEKIANADGKFFSVRIDDTYRGIVVRQQETGTYLLLWVDHHDDAYEWARRRRCSVNAVTGSLQVYEVVEEQTPVKSEAAPSLFAAVSDEQLAKIGVPSEQLRYVRAITSLDELDHAASSVPADAFEGLQWLANGFSFDEVIEVMAPDTNLPKNTSDLGNALQNITSLRSFVVVEGEEELASILRSPLDKWRTFLHPSQRTIVDRSYNGAARVLGGAGTGKTVVAMHRARTLAKGCTGDQRVLFTTFSTNLASDIRSSMSKLCATQELRRIDILNLDAWVARFLKEQGFEYRISYDQKELESLWQDAAIESGCTLGFEPSFYADEWAQVILAQDELTLEAYVHAKRAGRGSRLRRSDRMQIWGVVENYRQLMRERSVRDVDSAMRDARLVLEQNPTAAPYAYVVVDEAQDFSAPAFKLVRALAGEEHANDIFIVGDSHQRIYGKQAVLSRCGI
ncbi:MAG: UvrD-helicase domain-containing protein, partial [Atopobiaceae bacterium]|nr:UvrD-helicase domain-containing protein [Atopobiaceae bacterium]